jgi:putative membrane protein
MMAAWNLDPWVIGGVLLAAAVYARGVARLWRRAGTGVVVRRRRALAFAVGLYAVLLAVVSPLDALAHQLFTFHMVQHVLLLFVAAPLLVAGAPLLPALWALPRVPRRRLARLGATLPWLASAWHALTGPAAVWSVLAATLWIWHLPGPYQAAVRSPALHKLEHATMLGAALLFWWVVLQPQGRRRQDRAVALLLVFATKVQSATLGVIVTFAPRPLYPVYEAGASAWGLTLLQDQQLAGLVMGTVSGVAFLATGALLFLVWLRGLETRGPDRHGVSDHRIHGPPLS